MNASTLRILRLLLYGCAVATTLSAEAAAQLSLPDHTLAPGGTAPVAVSFSSTDSAVSGIQFDVEFDASVLKLDVQSIPGLAIAGKEIHVTDLKPNLKRVLIAGLNQNRIPDGPIVDLIVTSTTATGGSDTVHLQSALGVDATGDPILVTTRAGAITIGPPPTMRIATVLNAASFRGGAISPGEVIAIVGSGFTPQAYVSVNDVRAPVIAITDTRITAVVPYGTTIGSIADVTVSDAGDRSSVAIAVVAAAPGVFSMDASGSGQGVVFHEDLTVNSSSHPATAGGIIAMYVTGAGPVDPTASDGIINEVIGPRLTLPIRVQINGKEANVVYAGPAPGLISGIDQINARIPESLMGAGVTTVTLTIGAAQSQPGIFMFIR